MKYSPFSEVYNTKSFMSNAGFCSILLSCEQTIFIKMSGSNIALNELEYEFNIFCKSMYLTNEK